MNFTNILDMILNFNNLKLFYLIISGFLFSVIISISNNSNKILRLFRLYQSFINTFKRRNYKNSLMINKKITRINNKIDKSITSISELIEIDKDHVKRILSELGNLSMKIDLLKELYESKLGER